MPSSIDIHKSQALCRGKLVNGIRQGCDYDFTLEFNSQPPREKAYDYHCPKCGNRGQFKRIE